MQEDTKDFVRSKPAAGALFTILMGHLSLFSVDRFREKFQSYADGGLTRATMRLACGLEQALRAPRSTGDALELQSEPPIRRWNLLGPGAFLSSFRANRTKCCGIMFPCCHTASTTNWTSVKVPGQQATTGCLASCEGQGPTRCVARVEDFGVLEGTASQGQVRRF